jgi:hypothetical protein
MTFTTIDAQAGLTAAYTGSGTSISGFTGDWTLKINVYSYTPPSGATTASPFRFEFDDTVTTFASAYLAGPTVSFAGAFTSSADQVKAFRKQDFPDLRMGISGAQLRLVLSDIPSGASVSYRAWIES